jgi:hypothetical protein
VRGRRGGLLAFPAQARPPRPNGASLSRTKGCSIASAGLEISASSATLVKSGRWAGQRVDVFYSLAEFPVASQRRGPDPTTGPNDRTQRPRLSPLLLPTPMTNAELSFRAAPHASFTGRITCKFVIGPRLLLSSAHTNGRSPV